ncbi:MAG: multicopper oxidase domain-containing protein, partial [Acidimicrobiales bacterium]
MSEPHPLRLSRRGFLFAGAGAGAGLLLPACGRRSSSQDTAGSSADGAIVLVAGRSTVDLAGKEARTWTYDGRLPGREIRVRQGQRVRVRVENKLPEATSVHWHGIRLANPMDGVPGLTQEPIAPGGSFLYDFEVPDAGTFMFHSHVGLQLDRGLYGALIVEAAQEHLAYDTEAVILLDDWLDGVDGTPEGQLKKLNDNGMNMGAGGMGGMDMGGGGSRQGDNMNGLRLRDPKATHVALDGTAPGAGHLAGLATAMEDGKADPGDVQHPLYLMNGQPPKDPIVHEARAGDRVRLRLINIAGDTHFLFFVEGHELTVTHADGAPVKPVVTDGVVIGMG